jgi:hypothetical protein
MESSSDCGGLGGGPKLGAGGGGADATTSGTEALGAAPPGSEMAGGGLSGELVASGGDSGAAGGLGLPGFDAAQAVALVASKRNKARRLRIAKG